MKHPGILFLTVLAFFIISCSSELHRSGTMSENFIVSQDKLFITYENKGDRYILAVKLDPLSVKWEKKIAALSADAVFRLYDKHIVCNCGKDEICFLSKESGSKVFSFQSPLVMEKGYKGLTVSESRVFAICEESTICAYDIDQEKELWRYKFDGENSDLVFDFMVAEDTLFFGTENRIYALSAENGDMLWESEPLPGLKTYYPIGDTILVNYDVIDGLDIVTGESKWAAPYEGDRVRCVMDGMLVAQSETHFNILWLENGKEIGGYPREGVTMLNCQNQLSLVAYTVKKNPDVEEAAEYFDKIDIFDAGSGERVFDYRAKEGETVLNISAMLNDNFYIVLADEETEREARVDRYSYSEWEKDLSYSIPDPEAGKNIYITLTHIDNEYTIFRSAIMDLSENTPTKNHLYDTTTGKLLGELTKHPDIITPNNAYDIVIYDAYFNIIEKKITDFLK